MTCLTSSMTCIIRTIDTGLNLSVWKNVFAKVREFWEGYQVEIGLRGLGGVGETS